MSPRKQLRELVAIVAYLVKWIVLGAIVGVIAGCASAVFLKTLAWATDTRESHSWLLFVLPLAGFCVGLAYHYAGRDSAAGNNLIIDEIHEPKAWIPRRMAPLIFGGTILTHLFGGSAGREGTAIQMAGSLTDATFRSRRISPADRRLLLIAAIAGGFGSVFGVPLAGCIFALEVQSIGRIRYDAIVAALSASVVGDLVVRGLGVHHEKISQLAKVGLDPALIAKVIGAALLFGLTARAFVGLTHAVRRAFGARVRWAPARPVIGGFLVIGLTYVVGNRDYLGLSTELATKALAGAGVVLFAFALKLLFTSVTLGTGFQGGEVTPLFVIGATLGATLGRVTGAPITLMAALGFVAVFAAAANTPIACTVMAVEIFGAANIVLFAIACVIAYIASSQRGLYHTQRVDTPKHAVGDG
jgi:H+/Cl- antiporter ClcA